MPSPRSATPADTIVRWTTTLDDLVDGSHLTASGLRRIVKVVGIVALAFGAFSIVAGDPGFGAFLVLYGLLDFTVIGSRPVERVLISRRVRHLVGRPCVVEITADAVVIRQAGATGRLGWAALTGVREDAQTIALMTGRAVRFGIPKRAFATPEAAAAYRDEIVRRIDAAAGAEAR